MACPPLIIAPTRINAPVGGLISQEVYTANLLRTSVTVAVTGLPTGLVYDASTRRITGRVAASALPMGEASRDYDCEIRASDSEGTTMEALVVRVLPSQGTGQYAIPTLPAFGVMGGMEPDDLELASVAVHTPAFTRLGTMGGIDAPALEIAAPLRMPGLPAGGLGTMGGISAPALELDVTNIQPGG